MFERNWGPQRAGVLAMLVAGLFSGTALAEGNIQFGQGLPAVAEMPTAARGAERAQAARAVQGERIEHGPGVNRVILAPVTPEESERAIRARGLPKDLNQGVPRETGAASGASTATTLSAARVAGDTAPSGPASIAELARALKNDPDLIYAISSTSTSATTSPTTPPGASRKGRSARCSTIRAPPSIRPR